MLPGRELLDIIKNLERERDKERQIAEMQVITMNGLYQDIESLREAKDLFFRNAEAWEARAKAAETELAKAKEALEFYIRCEREEMRR